MADYAEPRLHILTEERICWIGQQAASLTFGHRELQAWKQDRQTMAQLGLDVLQISLRIEELQSALHAQLGHYNEVLLLFDSEAYFSPQSSKMYLVPRE